MTIHSQMPYLGRKYIKVKLGKATSSSRLTEKDNRERSQGWWQNKLFSAVVVVVIVGRPLFLVVVVITVIGVAYGEGVVAVTIFVAGLLLIFSYYSPSIYSTEANIDCKRRFTLSILPYIIFLIVKILVLILYITQRILNSCIADHGDNI